MMTENHGKVRAVAKGVRKTTSKFGARLEPLSHIDVLLSTTGKDLDIVSQVELVSSARGLYTDLDRLTRGLAMLEAVDQLGMDREPTSYLYKMLAGALTWLNENDSSLVLAAFYFKLLVVEGVGAQVDNCVGCGASNEQLVAFDMFKGGGQCRDCRTGLNRVLALSENFATREVSELATHCMEHHLERKLRSVSVFEHPER